MTSNFAEHIIFKGHEIRNIEDLMTVINTESNHTVNILEQIQIVRVAKLADIE